MWDNCFSELRQRMAEAVKERPRRVSVRAKEKGDDGEEKEEETEEEKEKSVTGSDETAASQPVSYDVLRGDGVATAAESDVQYPNVYADAFVESGEISAAPGNEAGTLETQASLPVGPSDNDQGDGEGEGEEGETARNEDEEEDDSKANIFFFAYFHFLKTQFSCLKSFDKASHAKEKSIYLLGSHSTGVRRKCVTRKGIV